MASYFRTYLPALRSIFKDRKPTSWSLLRKGCGQEGHSASGVFLFCLFIGICLYISMYGHWQLGVCFRVWSSSIWIASVDGHPASGGVFLFNLFFFFHFWPCCMAFGILVPRPGIEPTPPALEAPGKFPGGVFL